MIRKHRSKDYNWNFSTRDGTFCRWGKTFDDDPSMSPVGPEILDLEISTICHGPGTPCSFCYKGNSQHGSYMSFERFKTIVDKMPSNLTQIAFGIGDVDGNPDLEGILWYTRGRGIVPNITINGYRMTDKYLKLLAATCGSIAVSRYDDAQCFNTVKALTDIGATQVNIHQIFHDTTVDDCFKLLDSVEHDARLAKLNALLFLALKPKGRAKFEQPVTDTESFTRLVKRALMLTKIGFDSCSAPMFLQSVRGHSDFEDFTKLMEPCEAFLFSSYANVNGEFFPCSFCEGIEGWEEGMLVSESTDFMRDIWNSEKMTKWRRGLTTSSSGCECSLQQYCRSCPVFDITPCKRG